MVKDFLNVNTVKNNVYCKKYYLLKRLKYDIPTKNDALLIYGVGGTIDYIAYNNPLQYRLSNKLFNKILTK